MAHPNFKRGIGALATSSYTFADHVDGVADRHNANQIDISPPIIINGQSPLVVSDALSDIATVLASLESLGTSFVAIQDGYDTWHNADGSINYDPTVPALDTLLNPIFNAIYTGGTLTGEYARLKYGGILYIKSGTYIVQNSISVPPGITILGEGYGTKIVNATALNLGTPPTPAGSPVPLPVFIILPDNNRTVNDNAVDGATYFMFSRETKILNLVIGDNFIEAPILGDTYYKLPQNLTSSTTLNPPALISQKAGSNLTLDGVFLVGRANFLSPGVVSQATGNAIALDTTSSAPNGSLLKLTNCMVDGFSVPINFQSKAGSNDFLEIANSKIRSHGYYNGDSSDGFDNCFFLSNDNNSKINNNILYADNASVLTGLFVNGNLASPPVLQSRGKIIVNGNDVLFNKGSNSSTSFKYLDFNSTITTPATYVSSQVANNNIQDDFSIVIDNINIVSYNSGTSTLTIDNLTVSGSMTLSDGLTVTGAATNINDGLIVSSSGTTAIHNAATLSNGLTITGAATNVNDGLIVSSTGTTVINNAATFNDGLTIATGNFGITTGNLGITTGTLTVSAGLATFGNGITVNGALAALTDGLTVTGAATNINDGLVVSSTGTTTINNAATLHNGLTVDGAATNINDGLVVSSSGTTTVNNAATFNNGLSITSGGLGVTGGINASGNTLLSGLLWFAGLVTTSVSSGTYNVQAFDLVLFVNTQSGATTINLPSATNGRTIIVKDVGGVAGTGGHNIIIATTGALIDGTTSPSGINEDFTCLTLIADGTNWWFMSIVGTL